MAIIGVEHTNMGTVFGKSVSRSNNWIVVMEYLLHIGTCCERIFINKVEQAPLHIYFILMVSLTCTTGELKKKRSGITQRASST